MVASFIQNLMCQTFSFVSPLLLFSHCCVQVFAIQETEAHQSSLSFTTSQFAQIHVH